MSFELIRRYQCDAPDCTATIVVDGFSEARAAGWTALHSTDHLPQEGITVGTRRKIHVPLWELSTGDFSVELCPSHGNAFGVHHPRTQAAPRRRGDTFTGVTVSCACVEQGRSLGFVHSASLVGRRPAKTTHYRWWEHLPQELQGYALR